MLIQLAVGCRPRSLLKQDENALKTVRSFVPTRITLALESQAGAELVPGVGRLELWIVVSFTLYSLFHYQGRVDKATPS